MENRLFGDYKDTEITRKKLYSLDDIANLNNKVKVLNIGSYDIMHPGHCNTLYFSKNLNEMLGKFPDNYTELRSKYNGKLNPENVFMLVAMNSNESYRRLNKEYAKQGKKKISTHDESERVWQLANLGCVDGIVLFDDLTAQNVIKSYKPNILTKGGDYVLDPKEATKDKPPVDQEEKKLAESYGGLVVLTPLGADKDGKPYHSHHHFVQRILEKHGANNGR